jgi:serine/threonine-protein kinase
MLGSGGFATVYRARDPLEDRDVAVKVIPFSLWGGPSTRESDPNVQEGLDRFRREALALSRLRSKHIARVFDFGRDDAVGLYLVMELIDGVPLEVRSLGRALLPHEVLRVARGVLAGLAEAHAAGIVHRDIKPSNILVPRGPEALDHARILDFGIARVERRAQLLEEMGMGEPRNGKVLGTPAYMAPEMLLDGAITPAADVYAAGLVLFELLDVGPLFPGDTPRDQIKARLGAAPLIEHRVPPPLSALFARMLTPDPALRFRDGREALDGFGDLETAPVTIADLFPVEPKTAQDDDATLRVGRREAGIPSSSPPPPPSEAWGPRPSFRPSEPPAPRSSVGVAYGSKRLSRLAKDPTVALTETLSALDLAMIDALARRERGSTFARLARAVALALRLELDAAALILEPLASQSDLARALGACVVSPRARRVTRARVESDRTDAWCDTIDSELAGMLVAMATTMTLRDDATKNEARCRRVLERLGDATTPTVTTARMAQTCAASIAGTVPMSSAITELLRLRDADPQPPTSFNILVRALLLGLVGFRADEHLARENLERAAKLAAETSNTLLETRAMVAWGGMLVEIPDRVEQGLAVLERATTLLGHGDAPSLEHIAEHNRGAALVIQGRYSEAAPHLRRAREAAKGELSLEHEMLSCMNEGFSHICLGNRDAAASVVNEMTDARLAACSPRTAAYSHVVRSMYAMLFHSSETARAELRRAHACAATAEAEGADAYLLAEALGILYASARHEDIDLLTRAGELEKLAQDRGFVSFYWFDVLRAMVAQIRDAAVRLAVGETLERLIVLLGHADQPAKSGRNSA